MTLRHSIFQCVFIAVFAFLFAAANVSAADAPKPAVKIEFSAPTHGTLVTNVNALGEVADDKDTAEPHAVSSFHPRNPMAVMLPAGPAPEVIVNRSADPFGAGLLGSPEDMLREKLFKELLKVPGAESPGQSAEKNASSVHNMQNLYEQMLVGPTPEAKSPWRSYDSTSMQGNTDKPKTASRQNANASGWNDYFSPRGDSDSSVNSDSGFSGAGYRSAWGTVGADGYAHANDPGQNARAHDAQQNQLRQMEQVLNGNYDLEPVTPVSAGAGNALTGSNPWGNSPGQYSTPGDQHKAAGILANGPESIATTYSLAAPTAPTAPVPSSLAPLPPTLPARVPAPKPIFTVPQRMF